LLSSLCMNSTSRMGTAVRLIVVFVFTPSSLLGQSCSCLSDPLPCFAKFQHPHRVQQFS
jgi:hypothetical protein